MNRTRNLSITLAIVVLLALLSLVRTSPVTAWSKPTLTKKQLKTLIASAKTKEDHQKLADYYKAETEPLSRTEIGEALVSPVRQGSASSRWSTVD